MKILYAGDSPVGGPANYLLGILRHLKADFVHVPPAKILRPSFLKRRYDAILLSDFPRSHVPPASQKAIAAQVASGTGLLMVGGWASFSGPFGKWRGSVVEKLLPVKCLAGDDRVNLPGGAWIRLKKKHPVLRGLDFKNPPVICGLNRVRPRKDARVILAAKRIREGKEFPLLVLDPQKRIAALTTDLAPHWCGGLIDWGSRRKKLRVSSKAAIEAGDRYVDFVSRIVRWLAGARYSQEELEGLDRLHEREKKKGWTRLRTTKDIERLAP